MRYTNDSIHELIERARDGGANEQHDLMSAMYDVMMRCTCTSDRYTRLAKVNYESVHEAVADSLVYVMNNLIGKYDENLGSTPITYIMNGFVGKLTGAMCNERLRIQKDKYVHYVQAQHDMVRPLNLLEDWIDAEEADYRSNRVFSILRTLSLRHQDVIEAYLARETCRETAKKMGCTGSRVCQMRHEAVDLIKQILKRDM